MNAPLAARSPAAAFTEIRAAAKCLALDSLAQTTSTLLRNAGVSTLLLKGPATAWRLYPGQPERRVYCDVDLLVPPEMFVTAQQLLLSHGYRWRLTGVRVDELSGHETAWAAPNADLTVDLHRGFAGVDDHHAFWDAMWEARDQITLAGGPIALPDTVGTAMIIALHAAYPGKSPKPLADLLRAKVVFDMAIWSDAADRARACDAVSAFRAGLELLPGGTEMTTRLGLVNPVTDLWLADRQRSRVSVILDTAFMLPTWAQTVRYLVRKLFPSRALLRIVDPTARSGPAGLVLAFLRRWVRAGLGVARGFGDVRRATRQGHDSPVRFATRWSRTLGRALATVDIGSVRALVWAWRVLRRTRSRLATEPLNRIELSNPPASSRSARQAVIAALRAGKATCLERSLVLQRFDASAGNDRPLIIGVSAPGDGFHAHCWLDGDRQSDASLQEIFRLPPPR